MPEVSVGKVSGSISAIPESIRLQVIAKITELTGSEVDTGQRLANDLGLDSLTVMEMNSWLESEFGVTIGDLTALDTVQDCILAAAGQLMNHNDNEIAAPQKQ